jgi:glycosyltransferase involved in cell wall biosynthesis
MARVYLVVPCFNEAERLPEEQFRSFALASDELHLLFVDDGSRDATREVLGRLCDGAPERLHMLSLQQNQGKAEAVRRGVLAAVERGADLVEYWDADLATPLFELPRFCELFDERHDLDAVLGSRVRMLGRNIDRRTYRHAYGRVFATAVATLLDLPVYDTQCGSKLFRVNDELKSVFAEPFASPDTKLVEFAPAEISQVIDAGFLAPVSERFETVLLSGQSTRREFVSTGLLVHLDALLRVERPQVIVTHDYAHALQSRLCRVDCLLRKLPNFCCLCSDFGNLGHSR